MLVLAIIFRRKSAVSRNLHVLLSTRGRVLIFLMLLLGRVVLRWTLLIVTLKSGITRMPIFCRLLLAIVRV